MTIDEAVKFFGSARQMCLKLKIKPQNVTHWRRINRIPREQQFHLEKLSAGKLKADCKRYRKRPERRKIKEGINNLVDKGN